MPFLVGILNRICDSRILHTPLVTLNNHTPLCILQHCCRCCCGQPPFGCPPSPSPWLVRTSPLGFHVPFQCHICKTIDHSNHHTRFTNKRTDSFYCKLPPKETRKDSHKAWSMMSVGIATRYGLDGPGIESRWGARFSAPVQTGPGAYPASYTMGTGSFPGVKRPGRGADHPPTSSAEVEGRVELYICSPFGSSWPVLGWPLPLHFMINQLMHIYKCVQSHVIIQQHVSATL